MNNVMTKITESETAQSCSIEWIDNEDTLHVADIPYELCKLIPIVQKAAAIEYCHSKTEKAEAITTAAITFGSEEKIRTYGSNDSSPAAKVTSARMLAAIHPTPLDWGLIVQIPWERRSIKEITTSLAERSLADAYRGKRISNDEMLIRKCIGFGRLLADAERNLVDLGPESKLLQKSFAQLEDAWLRRDFNAKIEYVPCSDDDCEQMTFEDALYD